MATTTDFQEWLDNLDETSIEEIYCLYESVVGVTQMVGFNCSQNNGRLFIKTDQNDSTQMLASGKAVKAFLDKLDSEYGGDLGWVGGFTFGRTKFLI